MQPTLLLALVSFLACLVLTPVVRTWSVRFGVLDVPDGSRKIHRSPIPRTGGVAIMGAYLAALGLLLMPLFGGGASPKLSLMVGLLPAVAIVFATGLIDDLIGTSAITKLVGQVIAACVAYWAGVHVPGVAGLAANGWWSLPLTVVWLVGCANAFNLIDGIDGLAAGIGLIAAATTLFAAVINNNLPLALATAPLVGALLAFLHYNFNPASIFLGDCGSLTIGFLLGCFGAIWSQKATTLMGMTAPMMALSVPLLDTGLSVVRRFLRHQPILNGDRNHIHHRLLDRGFNTRDVAFALFGVGALAAAFALFQTATHSRYGGVVVVGFGLVAWVGVRSLGYLEFGTARYLASTGVFRHLLHVHVYLNDLEAKLAKATTAWDYWTAVRDASRSFGFIRVEMRLGGEVYQDDRSGRNLDQCCRVRIPLPAGEYVEFVHAADSSVQRAVALNALTDILQRSLGARTRQVAPAGVGESSESRVSFESSQARKTLAPPA